MALPSSCTAGGAKAKASESRKVLNFAWARLVRSNTLVASPSRSLNGLSRMNARPELWPRPAKLKPFTVKSELTILPSSLSR
ncbi:hypothetical protein D3C72_1420050 [compost metagenome]